MLCRIALWDCFIFCYWLFSGEAVDWVDVVSNCFMGLFYFLLLAIFRLSGRLGKCCVELLYGTVVFFVFGQKLSAKTALRVQFDTPRTLSQAQLQNG